MHPNVKSAPAPWTRRIAPLALVGSIGLLTYASAQAPPRPRPFNLVLPTGIPRPPIAGDNPLTVEGVALGQRLFSEVRLSGNNTLSCASCHRDNAAFSDAGREVSIGITGAAGTRNTPSLANTAFSRTWFWDGRSPSLRHQALQPIQNPVEMNQSLDATVAKLNADPSYRTQFAAAFGPGGITPARIGLALEQFQTTLLSGNTRFDTNTLTAQEQRGRTLFFAPFDPAGRRRGADCSRCHGGPTFSDNAFHDIGLDRNPVEPGRGAVTGNAGDNGKFKTPTLRNLTATGPYMHNGRFQTLEQVVRHYSNGIQPSRNLDPGLARQRGGLRLTPQEEADLVAFLRALTDPRWAGRNPAP